MPTVRASRGWRPASASDAGSVPEAPSGQIGRPVMPRIQLSPVPWARLATATRLHRRVLLPAFAGSAAAGTAGVGPGGATVATATATATPPPGIVTGTAPAGIVTGTAPAGTSPASAPGTPARGARRLPRPV